MEAGTNTLAEGQVSGETWGAEEFAVLAREASRLAFRVAYSVLRQRADAEEIAQEALLRAHRNFGRLREPARFRSWLVRVTWRLALDRIRAARRRQRREQAAGEQAAIAGAGESRSREFHYALAEEIQRLPRKLRQVLLLAAVGGYNTREVAQRMHLPEGTVKSRLFLARKRLAERLEWIADDTRMR
jgi:RNA polymerase sigma-70 factor (ECF subfamily)